MAFGPAQRAGPPPEDYLERTVTVNISAGGLCLYTDVLYPMGAQLYCSIAIPGRCAPLEAIGTVAWFQKVYQDVHGYKLGLEFAQIAAEDRALLERMVLEPTTGPLTRGKTLLLVDDDIELIQALKVRFESEGFCVLTAAEGLEALSMCRAQRPNLLILDLMLPKLNGYEVCRLLKFDQRFHNIPIVLFTARARQEDKELGFSVGADAYVTKPFDGKALLAKVEELLAVTRGAS